MTTAVIGPLSALASIALSAYVAGASYERASGVPSLTKVENVESD